MQQILVGKTVSVISIMLVSMGVSALVGREEEGQCGGGAIEGAGERGSHRKLRSSFGSCLQVIVMSM